jgi:hypothetical protein
MVLVLNAVVGCIPASDWLTLRVSATSREIDNLNAQVLKIGRAQISRAGHFQVGYRTYVHIPVDLGDLGIEGNRVGTGD